MKQALQNALGALSILAIFALCFFLIYMGADVLTENYANCPAWFGWALIVEGFAAYLVIVKNVIESVCFQD